jgi:peptide/nickel transport system permease protein
VVTAIELRNSLGVATPGGRRASRERGWLQRGRRTLRLYPLAVFGALVVCAAVLAPLIAPYDPAHQDLDLMLTGPSGAHLFGADELGRDILSRTLYGAQISLQVGVIAVMIAALLGIPLGLFAGYLGGWTDEVAMRLIDGLLAFPPLVLALGISGALGPSLNNLMVAVGIVYTPLFARVVRGQVLGVRQLEYVAAARLLGARGIRIILRHILPNVLASVIVLASLQIASAILAEAALSFLGLGVQPPTPSWGYMVNVGRNYMDQAPWLVIAPGAAILLTVLAFNFIGDGARDALDPRMSGRV